MCRLLGYAAPHATTVRTLLGPDQLDRFAQLSCVHGDGWGTAWLAAAVTPDSGGQPGPTLERYRSPAAAVDDPQMFARYTGAEDSPARLVHLRWASAGYEVDPRNSHPFVGDGLAFAHNGWIHPEDRFADLLPPDALAGVDGTTDSERYFALIRRELAATSQDQDRDQDRDRDRDQVSGPGGAAEAVRRAARSLRAVFPACSLNALVLTPTELVAVHANEGARGPVETLRAMGDAAPADHVAAYYQMRWRRLDDGTVVVASSGLDATGWTPMEPESVLRVDLATLAVTVGPLDTPSWQRAEPVPVA